MFLHLNSVLLHVVTDFKFLLQAGIYLIPSNDLKPRSEPARHVTPCTHIICTVHVQKFRSGSQSIEM